MSDNLSTAGINPNRASTVRTCLFSLGLAIALPAQGSEPHVHGLALLQVAVEGNRIDLIFSSPAANITGFEHMPANARQDKALADAVGFLKSRALVQSPMAKCTLEDAAVESALMQPVHHGVSHKAGKETHEGYGTEAGDHGHHHEDKEEHAHSGKGDDLPEEAHTDFRVSQQIHCAGNPGTELTTPLLARFRGVEQLQVQWITDSAQGTTTLDTGEDRLSTGR